MSYFTQEEQGIIDQATAILNSKLRTDKKPCNMAFYAKTYLRLELEKCQREHMGALYLDTALRLIEYRVVFSGCINSCTISSREFVKDALQLNASAIIVAHNHPSGNATPSQPDIESTRKIEEALNLFDIRLIDHFIVGHNQISSLREMNLI